MIKESDCLITIEVQPEDMPIKGNALDSGDDRTDREYEDEIRRKVNGGDEWAWVFVRVTVAFEGLSASGGLGGCSYADEAAFRADQYYKDMVTELLEEHNGQARRIAEKMNEA